MPKNILIVQGHPDPAGGHFCNALESAYANGARHAGHDVSIIHASTSDFSILRTQEEFDTGKLTADIKTAQTPSSGQTIWLLSIRCGLEPCRPCSRVFSSRFCVPISDF